MHGPVPNDELKAASEETVQVPNVIPIFPLPKVVLLPGEVLPLHIFEPRYRDLVRDALVSDKVMGIVEVLPGHEDELPGAPPVRDIGSVGLIASHEELPDGRFLLWLLGLERFRIAEELESGTSYRTVRVEYQPTPESPKRLTEILQLRQELRTMLPDLLDLNDQGKGQFQNHMSEVSDSQLIALACQILEVPSERKQQVLEADSLSDRFLMLYEDLYRHLDLNPEIDALSTDDLN